MDWSENKKIKLILIENGNTVMFEVKKEFKSEFHTAFEYLLSAFINTEGYFRDIVSTTDAETGEHVRLEIQVGGNPRSLISIIQQHADSLRPFCTNMG